MNFSEDLFRLYFFGQFLCFCCYSPLFFCLSPLENTYKSTRSGFVRWRRRRQATGDRRPSSVQSRVKSRLTLHLTECSVWQLKESQIIDYACMYILAEWGSIESTQIYLYVTLPVKYLQKHDCYKSFSVRIIIILCFRYQVSTFTYTKDFNKLNLLRHFDGTLVAIKLRWCSYLLLNLINDPMFVECYILSFCKHVGRGFYKQDNCFPEFL